MTGAALARVSRPARSRSGSRRRCRRRRRAPRPRRPRSRARAAIAASASAARSAADGSSPGRVGRVGRGSRSGQPSAEKPREPDRRDGREAGLQRIERLDGGLGDGGRDAREVWRVGHRLGHRRDARRVALGHEALEERVHLGLERLDRRADALHARLDDQRMRVDLASRAPSCGRRSAPRSPRGSARSRPWTIHGPWRRRRRRDGGGGGLDRRRRLDLLDDRLRIGEESRHRLVARGLGGGLHRPTQVGHELGRACGSWRKASIRSCPSSRAPRWSWVRRAARRCRARRPPVGRPRSSRESREA